MPHAAFVGHQIRRVQAVTVRRLHVDLPVDDLSVVRAVDQPHRFVSGPTLDAGLDVQRATEPGRCVTGQNLQNPHPGRTSHIGGRGHYPGKGLERILG